MPQILSTIMPCCYPRKPEKVSVITPETTIEIVPPNKTEITNLPQNLVEQFETSVSYDLLEPDEIPILSSQAEIKPPEYDRLEDDNNNNPGFQIQGLQDIIDEIDLSCSHMEDDIQILKSGTLGLVHENGLMKKSLVQQSNQNPNRGRNKYKKFQSPLKYIEEINAMRRRLEFIISENYILRAENEELKMQIHEANNEQTLEDFNNNLNCLSSTSTLGTTSQSGFSAISQDEEAASIDTLFMYLDNESVASDDTFDYSYSSESGDRS